MTGTRLSVLVTGGDARIWMDAARLAETFGLGLWISGAASDGPGFGDAYLATAAAALAGVTEHVRIGVVAAVAADVSPLRLAEDLAVVDQASRGRVELILRAPRDDAGWIDRVEAMLAAWHHWPAQDGRVVSASPRPAQPQLPVLVAGPAELAARLGAGRLLEEPVADPEPAARRHRRVLAVTIDEEVGGWLAPDPIARIASLRDLVTEAAAHELVVRVPWVDRERLIADLQALGVVVAAAIRCSAHQAPFLARDAFAWLTERVDLHEAPHVH